MLKMIGRLGGVVTRVFGLMFCVCLLTFFFVPVCSGGTTIVHATEVDEIDGSGAVDTEGNDDFNLSISTNEGSTSLSSSLKIVAVLTVIALAPSILVLMTSFTRILVVLHFTRSALGTQTTPPNQVLIGLSLFLTLFIMAPVFNKINVDAIQPYDKGEITQEQALDAGLAPLRTFMLEQTDRKDLKMFLEISDVSTEELENSVDNIPTTTIIPAFVVSELRKAFIIGFLIYLPFIIIDMVVASTLMSMGMMMLPPTTISMPFKILLFVMADGWGLIIGQLVKTFY